MGHRLSILFLACLAGCSKPSLQDVVRERLADPASDQISNITYSDRGNFACVEIHSKSGPNPFHRREAYYRKVAGKWAHVYDYPETHSECVQLINTLDRDTKRLKNNGA